MNNSWRNGSNNSSGFVYFNTNNSCQNLNTSDFMAFNDPYGSPKCNRFSPVHYSSPRNFYGRPPGRNSFRYHNSRENNSFNSSNRSYNSTGFNNSGKKSGHQHGKNNNSFQNNGEKNLSKYYDHTCLKNPWAELELKLKKTQESEAKADPVIVEKENTDVEESSSSADEQESESETKTSSSEVEDGTT
ncbi:GATA zinc finger domain-containing protein 14-like [Anoplophora glabripennis]|uniref:GATA zinc finger domain-containing protein 14-like n=1 Tax=Anoplophora glabripennis TaxID=217634 RepID=UPI0008756E5C|nr:GATA zinc finger domain-containing protein 14-like [Anoplophora glabripennis]